MIYHAQQESDLQNIGITRFSKINQSRFLFLGTTLMSGNGRHNMQQNGLPLFQAVADAETAYGKTDLRTAAAYIDLCKFYKETRNISGVKDCLKRLKAIAKANAYALESVDELKKYIRNY
ncbi:MAG: hypothetical protein K2Y39_14350 [Candidatus Obscuribacterales bacterium]|nr:hypothetical protein [Candidatus Obscuribacterales bacterium]